jgi:branched-chain amino acid transport system substrate-binding protein
VHNGTITYRLATMEKLPAASSDSSTSPPASAPGETVPPSQPYARIGEEGIACAGPHLADIQAQDMRVVLFGPGAGELAQSPEVRRSLAAAQPVQLIPVESDQNWGAASTQLVRALMDQHAVAVIALDRNAAHLAEQLAIKLLVPVVAISSDRTLTSINIPWIFRMPAETSPGAALHLLGDVLAQSGPNPERLRDLLASGQAFDGTAFASTGEPIAARPPEF